MISVEELYALFLQTTGISIDTRTLSSGNMFFCLRGEHFNGNAFAGEALDRKALFVVTDDPACCIDERCILVNDTLKSLQELAHYHRTKLALPVIGITGTNGKTTTKELISAVLSAKYNVHATQGNLNNHIGVPLTLLSIKADHTQIAVVEMGANHLGEIAELCRIVSPTHGMITNIGKAHLEGFGSVEGIIQTKSALYKSVKEQQGTVFVNAEDELLMGLSMNINRITYGKSGYYRGICHDDSLLMRFALPDYGTDIQTQITGSYNFYNAMAAVAVGLHFGVSVEEIRTALENYLPTNSRSQVIRKADRTIITDAYNANPSSMETAIVNLAKLPCSSKAVLLGDMFELGKDSLQEHQRIVDLLRRNAFDHVYLLGEEFAKTDADTSWIYTDYSQMALSLEKTLPKEIIVLLKGSRIMKMERFLDIL